MVVVVVVLCHVLGCLAILVTKVNLNENRTTKKHAKGILHQLVVIVEASDVENSRRRHRCVMLRPRSSDAVSKVK
jgi:hypothetical protein